MKPPTRKLLPSLLLLGLVSTPVLAQTNTVKVVCVDTAGKPIKDLIVSLQNLGLASVVTDKTNKKGEAEFKKLENGVYRVFARAEGFEPVFKEFLELDGDATENVRLEFVAGDSTKQLYFEDQTANQNLVRLITESSEAYQNGNFDEADSKLREAIKTNPTSPDAYQNLGVVLLQERKFDEAEKTLQETARLLKIYVKIYANTPQGPAMQQRLAGVEKLLEQMPLQKLNAAGDDALKAKQYDTAIEKYRAMLEIEPDNPAVYYNIALAEAHSGKTADAKNSVTKALELKPGDEGFQRLLSQIEELEKQGISLKAKENIEEIEKLLKDKKYAEALAKSEASLSETPDEYKWTIHLFKARSYVGLDKSAEAIAEFETAAQAEPEKADLRREYANYLFQQGKLSEGVRVYSEALTIEGKPVAPELFKLGSNLQRQGNADGAGEVFERVIEKDPSYAEAYYELGLHHYYDTKDLAKAKTLLSKYVELGKDDNHLDTAKSVLQVIAKTKK